MLIKRSVANFFDKIGLVRGGVNRNDRVGMLHKCWGYVFSNLLEGAYYEFGLYQGATFLESWRVYRKFQEWVSSQARSSEPWRRDMVEGFKDYEHVFYGFDTFGGIPDNNEGSKCFQKGSYSSPRDILDEKCRKRNMRYRLFEGLFADLDEKEVLGLQPAAVINIDGDLYLSARDALEKVKGKIRQGTVLLMDDYNCFMADDAKGERRALKEFREKYPRHGFEPWFSYQHVGQAFFCHIDEDRN